MIWLTEIIRLNVLTNEMDCWCGPRIEADSFEEAMFKAMRVKNCHVLGTLIEEINYEQPGEAWLN
jgi:hypothetical protein